MKEYAKMLWESMTTATKITIIISISVGIVLAGVVFRESVYGWLIRVDGSEFPNKPKAHYKEDRNFVSCLQKKSPQGIIDECRKSKHGILECLAVTAPDDVIKKCEKKK